MSMPYFSTDTALLLLDKIFKYVHLLYNGVDVNLNHFIFDPDDDDITRHCALPFQNCVNLIWNSTTFESMFLTSIREPILLRALITNPDRWRIDHDEYLHRDGPLADNINWTTADIISCRQPDGINFALRHGNKDLLLHLVLNRDLDPDRSLFMQVFEWCLHNHKFNHDALSMMLRNMTRVNLVSVDDWIWPIEYFVSRSEIDGTGIQLKMTHLAEFDHVGWNEQHLYRYTHALTRVENTIKTKLKAQQEYKLFAFKTLAATANELHILPDLQRIVAAYCNMSF
jgi:hypothetical protein